LSAIYVEDEGNGQLYYAYTDYLGSLTALSDVDGEVVERQAFDPWGNRRDPDDWASLITTPVSHITGRGYTMHEHLDGFSLINMNGRVYDPQIARFLSPDPILQQPDYWLNYNRYGYCLNNPLIYTDPSGYTWKIFEPFVNAWDWFWDTADQSARFLNEKGISVNFQVGVNSTDGFYTESGGHRQYANQIGVDPAQQVNNRINEARGRGAYVSGNSSLENAAPRNEDINLGNIFAGVTIAKEAGQALYRINSKELHNLQNILEANHEINSIKINDQLLKVVRAGKIIKRIGFVGNVANLGAIGYDIMEQNGEVTTENAIDGAFGVVSFVPNVGWIISSVYSLNKEASKTGYYFSGDLILW
jgi:RHS repeat-associated protein